MSQLLALAWLKWALFRNSMRSKRAAVGSVASTVGMLVALAASLFVAAGLGFGAYLLASYAPAGAGDAAESHDGAGYFLLLFMLTVAYMMWALTPLALGGGDRFGPSRMLLYPVSLAKLFAIDFITDLTSLTAVFVVPSVFALGAGVGLARGRLFSCLLVSLCAVAFGLSLSKLLSVGIGALMKSRRTRGETLLALLGGLLGMTGALMGQLMPYFERHGEYLEAARWTPPGAAAYALARGTRAGHGADFTLSLLTLAAYVTVCVFAAYRVARRTALGGGGGGGGSRLRAQALKANAAGARAAGAEAEYAGWRLPFVSPQFSAVFPNHSSAMWPTIGSREENNQTDATATTLAITPPTAAWVSSRVLRRCRGMPRAGTSVKAMLPIPLVTPMPSPTPRKVRLMAAARSGSSRLIVDRAKRKPADAAAVTAMTVRLRRRVASTFGART